MFYNYLNEKCLNRFTIYNSQKIESIQIFFSGSNYYYHRKKLVKSFILVWCYFKKKMVSEYYYIIVSKNVKESIEQTKKNIAIMWKKAFSSLYIYIFFIYYAGKALRTGVLGKEVLRPFHYVRPIILLQRVIVPPSTS